MDYGLDGKRALVLGSSRGLGLGIATALAGEGANVLLCGRTLERLTTAVEAINAKGQGNADYTINDLNDTDSAQNLYDAAIQKLGGVDILVTNSGGPPPGRVRKTASEDWRNHFDSMVLRQIEITELCLPGMRTAGWGRVISIGSSGVEQPIPMLGMSTALRSSLVGWSKSLSTEVAADGITVNMLIPGRIQTERLDEFDASASQRQDISLKHIIAASQATIPAGRYGTVEEFAAVAAFLASTGASYVTGSIVRCDGGFIRSV